MSRRDDGGERLIGESAGVNLRELRLARGWYQCQLARKSGVSRRTIWGIEAGRVKARAPTRKKLLAALGFEWARQADVFGPLG